PAEIATGVAAGDGRVLTVAHVLAGGGRARVAGLPATVLRLDERLDLAVLAVPGLRARGLWLAPSAGGVALRVLRDGRPRTVRAAVRRTVIAHVREAPGDPVRTRPGLELAAHVVAGDSGAPVTDAERHPARLRVAARRAPHATHADGHPAEREQVRGLEDGLDRQLDVDAAARAPGAQRDLRGNRRRVGLGVRGRVAVAPGVLVEV